MGDGMNSAPPPCPGKFKTPAMSRVNIIMGPIIKTHLGHTWFG